MAVRERVMPCTSGGLVAVDVSGEGADGVEGGVDFLALFFDDDVEVFIEEDGDFEDVDGVEAEAGFSEDEGVGGDGLGGAAVEAEAVGEDGDEVVFGGGHGGSCVRW